MCFHTLHHYPTCGHIANWTVTSCQPYTASLRLLGQQDVSQDGKYSAIEGLQSPSPVLEVFGRLSTAEIQEMPHETPRSLTKFASNLDQPRSSQLTNVCECREKWFTSPSMPPVTDHTQCIGKSDSVSSSPRQEILDFMLRDLSADEAAIADSWNILREKALAEAISPSSTQVGARGSRNSLLGAISRISRQFVKTQEYCHCPDSPSWFDFELSDESSIDSDSLFAKCCVKDPYVDNHKDESLPASCHVSSSPIAEYDSAFIDENLLTDDFLWTYPPAISSEENLLERALSSDTQPINVSASELILSPAPLRITKPPRFVSEESALENVRKEMQASNDKTRSSGLGPRLTVSKAIWTKLKNLLMTR
ncbi:Uncharacterized protein PECH_005458 [Penicillium ucsense]|uniref:Uncharacterized protein n=1 Tax=Penicillium ucsense TaxID=2839758 RepID=A0A8J8W4H9_9EURO|nr:Uncharacterized protein PECM_004188 [Penicillium ucsense]KAF7736355.1 Uncharacterized protein PECH_005458 [Penicillium ucsense]